MTNLEFIEKEIEETQSSYKAFELDYELFHRESDNRDADKYLKKLIHLQQIKAELEVMELIKNGWSSTETTLNGECIMRFQNLTINDWLKLCNKLDEILLKKRLGEVENVKNKR